MGNLRLRFSVYLVDGFSKNDGYRDKADDILLVPPLILFSRHFFTEPLSESFHKTWLLFEGSLDRNWNSWSEIPNLWLIVTADRVCTLYFELTPLSQDCHQDIVKTLFSTDIVLLSGIVFSQFFKKYIQLPSFSFSASSHHWQLFTLSTFHLTSISTLSHFYLNTINTISLPSQHCSHWHTSSNPAHPLLIFSLVISQWSSLRLPKLYFWVLNPKKYEQQHNTAVGLVQLEKNSVCNRENVSAHYQYLSYVIHPPCNFTVLEQEIHGYLNPCLARLILRQLLWISHRNNTLSDNTFDVPHNSQQEKNSSSSASTAESILNSILTHLIVCIAVSLFWFPKADKNNSAVQQNLSQLFPSRISLSILNSGLISCWNHYEEKQFQDLCQSWSRISLGIFFTFWIWIILTVFIFEDSKLKMTFSAETDVKNCLCNSGWIE